MKWLFALGLAVIVFGGGAFFTYELFVRPEAAVRTESKFEERARPTPDYTLPELQAAVKLQQEKKLMEARTALNAFLQRYPNGLHSEEAKDAMGEVNMDSLLSSYPSPEMQEYIVKRGDVLARVAQKMKTTPELIMRMNNLNGTMLHIGERLLVSQPDFSLLIQRQARLVVLFDRGAFFKRYHVLEVKLPERQPPKITTRVVEIMAWKNSRRVGFGTKDYPNSTRWIRLGATGHILYALPDSAHPEPLQPPPAQGLGLAAGDLVELSSLVNSKTAVTVTD
jgi:LysM repeat protein